MAKLTNIGRGLVQTTTIITWNYTLSEFAPGASNWTYTSTEGVQDPVTGHYIVGSSVYTYTYTIPNSSHWVSSLKTSGSINNIPNSGALGGWYGTVSYTHSTRTITFKVLQFISDQTLTTEELNALTVQAVISYQIESISYIPGVYKQCYLGNQPFFIRVAGLILRDYVDVDVYEGFDYISIEIYNGSDRDIVINGYLDITDSGGYEYSDNPDDYTIAPGDYGYVEAYSADGYEVVAWSASLDFTANNAEGFVYDA